MVTTLLTIREASRLIGRTPATLRRYIRSGRLTAVKEAGKFGEEYKISREDLLALGFAATSEDLPVRVEPARPLTVIPHEEGPSVPLSLYNELLMKHERILVQYGMIRAGGQKLLEYKAEAESKEADLLEARERLQSLRLRATREIKSLRRQLREREIEVEERTIEATLLRETVKRLETAASGFPRAGSLEDNVVEIRQKERAIERIEVGEGIGTPSFGAPETWPGSFPPEDRGEDH
jgi:excisionase family DNA binding protein